MIPTLFLLVINENIQNCMFKRTFLLQKMILSED